LGRLVRHDALDERTSRVRNENNGCEELFNDRDDPDGLHNRAGLEALQAVK
jgi:hypothetical protein